MSTTPAPVTEKDASNADASSAERPLTMADLGVDEKQLVRKMDIALIPLVMLLYMFSFLDRVNIGNARLYGLEADLGMHGNQYQLSVSILFVTYLAFEVPSNLVLKKFTPSRWIAFIAVAWGTIATLTGIVQSYGGLLACRVLLGVVEAGLFPGLNVYLTMFYTRREIALRVGFLFVSAALAGALGGLLAYGIGHMDGLAGMSGWRWILIIEGLPTPLLGVAAWFLLPNEPETAYFLNDAEKRAVTLRWAGEYGSTKSAQQFSKEDMMKAFLDIKVWIFCAGQFGADTMLYGFSTFLPTIIKSLGQWTTAEVQLLTVPVYFLGAAAYMGSAVWSDRIQRRGVFCVAFGLISVVGYAVLLSDSSAGVHYFGCFLVAMGLYVIVGVPLAWMPTLCPRYGKRTTANGLQLTLGNASGIMAPFIYASADAPRYVRGHAVTLAMVAFAAAVYGFMWWYLGYLNKCRDAQEQKAIDEGVPLASREELEEMGDESPYFRYIT